MVVPYLAFIDLLIEVICFGNIYFQNLLFLLKLTKNLNKDIYDWIKKL